MSSNNVSKYNRKDKRDEWKLCAILINIIKYVHVDRNYVIMFAFLINQSPSGHAF